MLESDSARQLFEPELNQKTDTIFYALGILEGMQELADHYVLQGEMRGDLVQTTYYTDNNLRQLANFSATTANKYDSAYVYYRVINNCNYYVAHIDTTLRTGSDYVMMDEYIAVKAIRAWAYMQLGRLYERVPFYTEPLTSISQIDEGNFPELDLSGLVSALAPDLEQYAQEKVYDVPKYSGTPTNAGFNPNYIFIPVDVVLGEMYLETNDYANAAKHYIRYLTRVTDSPSSAYMQSFVSSRRNFNFDNLPSDWSRDNFNSWTLGNPWSNIFTAVTSEYITIFPMAQSARYGTTTMLPLYFGYDYYATDKSGESRYVDEVQITASQAFLDLSNSVEYYYKSSQSDDERTIINKAALGDQRYSAVIHERADASTDSTMVWITKYNTGGRIPLYRKSTVLLHLAEALNRLGLPDAAFAILKDGINQYLGYAFYITPETYEQLTTAYPLLSEENRAKFTSTASFIGIHAHGAGQVFDVELLSNTYMQGLSPYSYDSELERKLQEIASSYGVTVGATKQDSINAMEDLLCDEYALEFAFEGRRFYDLCRLARHKNQAALYGADFGSRWLAAKLAYKNPVVDLTAPKNWFLPFK